MPDGNEVGSLTERFLGKHLNEKGVNKLKNKFDELSGPAKEFDSLGATGWGFAAMAGIGVPLRLSEGDGLFEAVGKEMAEDAMYTMAPELLAGQIGKMAAEVYPKVNRALEQKRSFNMNYNFLGGPKEYTDTQANYTSRSKGVKAMKLNRMQMANLGGEARKHHRRY